MSIVYIFGSNSTSKDVFERDSTGQTEEDYNQLSHPSDIRRCVSRGGSSNYQLQAYSQLTSLEHPANPLLTTLSHIEEVS